MTRTRPRPAASRRAPRIALALAGGGPLGAIYEIGALCALDDALDGLDLNACDHYVGVSAGGFIAAALANGISPRELCETFIEDRPRLDGFDPAWLMQPAWGEFARRLRTLPRLAGEAAWSWLVQGKALSQAAERLGAALPAGVLDNDIIHREIARLFSLPGRSNRFGDLRSRLTLVATDLDSGEAAPFGQPGWDHVPISLAIQASAALPGLFPPVEIDGRHYVDGALKKTMHASVALDEGVDLLLCINPLVPYHATPDATHEGRIPALVEGGLPVVMSQTFRSMIHSRLVLAFERYERTYPDTDIVLIEPDQRDAELFFANTFSYRQRREMAEHAYQRTRALLKLRAGRLEPQLAPHGIRINHALLADPAQRLIDTRWQPADSAVAMRLHRVLDELQRRLPTAA
ncbi:patatin-like phospholipase family protein [uncultured Hydrogenophaga sp.]|uniref:patatin-like phospholipase family protein n=1 Tax=uncultured Hydrogenophaga sp. TaxID=199683 RepID=UPI00258326F1|nr:patatin-like phospholipase family protein [uncultured Hydrogenophaga sp.]